MVKSRLGIVVLVMKNRVRESEREKRRTQIRYSDYAKKKCRTGNIKAGNIKEGLYIV